MSSYYNASYHSETYEEDNFSKTSFDSRPSTDPDQYGGRQGQKIVSQFTSSLDTYGFSQRGGAVSLDVYGKKWTELHEWEVAETGNQRILFHLGGKYKVMGMSLKLTQGDKDGPLVARIEKAPFKQSEMEISMATGWSVTFKRGNMLSNSFGFRGPDGKEYKWKQTVMSAGKLVRDGDDTVATWEVVMSGVSKSNRLFIQPSVVFMTDVILATVLAWEAYAVETLRSSTSAGGQAK
ncbi:hypothetical protein ACM66B_006914 [Microbotryomycetes sp. NB124-2]